MSVRDRRTAADLQTSIRKATTLVECAPKRKHVRACIVYTWDHHNSQAFWQALKVLPIIASDVQTFKALILIHKILQEGHSCALKDGQYQYSFLESLARNHPREGEKGYGPLIRAYVEYLIAKLRFHRSHTEFNGTFEYEEYISLKNLSDPNEGYEVVTDLMALQDQIDSLQKLIFSSFLPGSSNECKISSLVPLVVESYGIYKFITSMLRAFYSSLQIDDFLLPLKESYEAQHHRLIKFYYECSNLRYLTNLILIPKLPIDPPDVSLSEDEVPALPLRPAQTGSDVRNGDVRPGSIASSVDSNEPSFDEEEEERKKQQLELQRQQQQAMEQRQKAFEEQRRQLEMNERLAQEQLLRDQMQRQAQGRVAELEQELLNMRGQYDRDQMMLQHYDQRVRAMENEMLQTQNLLNDQASSRNQELEFLREEVQRWKNKYEALAKLYTQLREEHLDLIAKHKQLSIKASSAEEAIDIKERMEKEMKAKNLELADMIRERDRTRYEADRIKSNQKAEIEKAKRETRIELDKQIDELKQKLQQLGKDLETRHGSQKDLEQKISELENINNEKTEEIEIQKAELDATVDQLKTLHIDGVRQDSHLKVLSILDASLQAASERVDDSIYELESTMQAGNQSATPEFLMSSLNRGGLSCNDFATGMNDFISDELEGEVVPAVKALSIFVSSVGEILHNGKGMVHFAPPKIADEIIFRLKELARASQKFFSSLLSETLGNKDTEQKVEAVINGNIAVQSEIQQLQKLADTYIDSRTKRVGGSDDLDKVVDSEFTKVAETIDNALNRLQLLMNAHKKYDISMSDRWIHEALFEAANAIMGAVAKLVKYASETQAEIVKQGRGTLSPSAFYKRNSKWTEGLISAAKSVANATGILIDIADGVVNGKQSFEHVIVACNEVAASTAQLVAASRVRASQSSKALERLEDASKEVGTLCRNFVAKVESMLNRQQQDDPDAGKYETMSAHEFKVKEMEQQVAILRFEQELALARRKLGEMRKFSYRFEEEE